MEFLQFYLQGFLPCSSCKIFFHKFVPGIPARTLLGFIKQVLLGSLQESLKEILRDFFSNYGSGCSRFTLRKFTLTCFPGIPLDYFSRNFLSDSLSDFPGNFSGELIRRSVGIHLRIPPEIPSEISFKKNPTYSSRSIEGIFSMDNSLTLSRNWSRNFFRNSTKIPLRILQCFP